MRTKKSKLKESWTTLLKFKKEYFTIIEHCPYNDLPLNEDNINLTRTPLVKNNFRTELIPDIFGDGEVTKHRFNEKIVDVLLFKPKSSSSDKNSVNEKTWLKKSVDLLNTAIVNRITIVLERNNNKVKLSIFNFSKSRQAGHRYFAKKSDDLHITFNIKTKNFFITKSTFSNRKRSVSTTKNDFNKILNLLNKISLEDLLLKNTWYDGHMDRKPNNQKDIIGLRDFMCLVEKKLNEELNVKFDLSSFGSGLGRGIMAWFIKVWRIKVPNNYYPYLLCHYPGIRNLRKHKMNLGRAVLINKGLFGKYYIKLINDSKTYNLTDLKKLEWLLGTSYCKLVPKRFLQLTSCNFDGKGHEPDLATRPPNLTKYEKLNLIKLMSRSLLPDLLNLIEDHIRIKNKLMNFGMDVKIKCKNIKQFTNEHSEWSDLIHLCERNKQTTYSYDHDFIETMEKPIMYMNTLEGNIIKYDVTLLKTDLEYFNEGQYQQHCVRTYLDKYDSMIFSVRGHSESEYKRMTVEFDYGNENLKDYRRPGIVQAQMKFNQKPNGEWLEILNELNSRFKNFKNLKKPKIEIYNKLTRKKIVFDRDKGELPPKELLRMGRENIMVDDLPF